MEPANISIQTTTSRTRKAVFLLAALGLVCVLGVFVWLNQAWWRGEPALVVEVLASGLKRRNDLLYQTNGALPFTGFMIGKYPSGATRSRSSILNGKLDGVSEGWHTNQQIQVRENFVNGVSYGPRIKWYLNGQEASECAIVNGRIEGLFRRWHENGKLAEEIQMTNGVPEGRSRSWHPSGYLQAEAEMAHGKAIHSKQWADGEFKETMDNAQKGR